MIKLVILLLRLLFSFLFSFLGFFMFLQDFRIFFVYFIPGFIIIVFFTKFFIKFITLKKSKCGFLTWFFWIVLAILNFFFIFIFVLDIGLLFWNSKSKSCYCREPIKPLSLSKREDFLNLNGFNLSLRNVEGFSDLSSFNLRLPKGGDLSSFNLKNGLDKVESVYTSPSGSEGHSFVGSLKYFAIFSLVGALIIIYDVFS